MNKSYDAQIRHLTREVQCSLNGMFDVPGAPQPGSGLDQLGLRDGEEIVLDYLTHNEIGLALEHLLYMIREPPVTLNDEARSVLKSLCEAFGLEDELE